MMKTADKCEVLVLAIFVLEVSSLEHWQQVLLNIARNYKVPKQLQRALKTA